MWEKVKSFFKSVWQYVVRYPMAVVGAVIFFTALTLLFVVMPGRAKRVNIGGALGWLFGEENVAPRLPVQVKRPVLVGVPDKEGYVEHESEGHIIMETGPFRDKSKVVVVDRNGLKHPVQLPSGVVDTDVRRIIEVHGDKVVVEIKGRPEARVTEDMLKYFIIISIVLVSIPAYSQECPSGFKCIPDAQAAKAKAVLEEFACMERAAASGGLGITLNAYPIVVTQAGQILSHEYLTGTLSWCAWEIQWKMKPSFSVTKEAPPLIPTYGARVRVRLGAAFVFDLDRSLRNSIDPILLLESLYWRSLHISTYLGFQTLGTSLGIDITKNLDTYFGVGVRWGSWEVQPVFGLSVSIN